MDTNPLIQVMIMLSVSATAVLTAWLVIVTRRQGDPRIVSFKRIDNFSVRFKFSDGKKITGIAARIQGPMIRYELKTWYGKRSVDATDPICSRHIMEIEQHRAAFPVLPEADGPS